MSVVSENLSDNELSAIGSGVGPNELQKIAVRYLHVPQPAIDTYKASAREDMEVFKFKLLEHWRNQNPGPKAQKKLFDCLEQAREKEGLINISCYKFLMENDTSMQMSHEDLQQIMEKIATVLKAEFKDTMKIQMTPWKDAHKVRMEDLYTRLKIEKHTINPDATKKEELTDYKELFQNLAANKRILIKGNPGIGKTTLARKLIFDWAHDEWVDSEMNSIHLVFLVTLKYIGPNQTIEEMIKTQHSCLAKSKDTTLEGLKEILERCGKDCLVILEGYDEIPEKYRKHLQDVMENKLYRDCHVLVTSRPNAVEEMEGFMATIASIEGFSKEKTKEYIEKVVKDPTKQKATFEYTENSVIAEMWRYPILVLFLCLLVNWGEIDLNAETLPVGEFYTRLLNCLYRRYVAKLLENVACNGRDDHEEQERENVLLKIGKIAFHGILTNKVAFKKREILKEVGPDAFAYGILIGSDEYDGNRFLNENADIFVFFAHRSIQEYLAAKYFIHKLSTRSSGVSDLLGRNCKLEFIQNNLMFFTICGYFTRSASAGQESKSQKQSFISSLLSHFTQSGPRDKSKVKRKTEDTIRSELVDYISKSLNQSKLTVESVSIHEESSWLFLEALPKCSKISNLHLKNLKPEVPLPNLLKGLSESLTDLHIESCGTSNTHGEVDKSIIFRELKNIKFSGSLGNLRILLCPAWKAVKSLDINEDNMTKQDMAAICQAFREGFLPNLKLRTVKYNEISTKYNNEISTHDMSVVSLLCGAQVDTQCLNLFQHRMFPQLVLAIAEANRNNILPSITQIYAQSNSDMSGKLGILLSSKWLKLHTLNLIRTSLRECDFSALSKANKEGYLPSLKSLILIENHNLSAAGLSDLLVDTWSSLEELNMNMCALHSVDVEFLGRANEKQLFPHVNELCMAGNPEISCSLKVLFSSPWHVLKKLVLDLCSLTSDDAEAIGRANRKMLLPNLQVLCLSENPGISGTGLRALLDHFWLVLRELLLDNCSLDSEDLKSLRDAKRRHCLPCIEKLYLQGNDALSDTFEILFLETWPTLQELGLTNCSMTAGDGHAFMKGFQNNNFLQLRICYYMAGNNISSDIKKQLDQEIQLNRKRHLWP